MGRALRRKLQVHLALFIACSVGLGCDKSTGAEGAPEIATFVADPSTVVTGVPTDVTWSWTFEGDPTPAPTCTIDNGVGALDEGGSSSVTLTADATFTLTCTNSAGQDTAQTAVTLEPAFIRVEGDALMLRDEEFVVAGMSHIAAYEAPTSMPVPGPHGIAWNEFDQAAIVADLDELVALGAVSVRQWAPVANFHTGETTVDATICDRFHWYLDRIGERGLHVTPALNIVNRAVLANLFCEGNCFVDNNPQTKWVWLTDPVIRQYVIDVNTRFISDCGLADRPEIMAWSLWNEPQTGDETIRHMWSPVHAWNQYLMQQHGSIASAIASWGGYNPGQDCGRFDDELCPPNNDELCDAVTSPLMAMEYRRFADAILLDAYSDFAAAVRAVDGNHLLTGGWIGHVRAGAGLPETECRHLGYEGDPRVQQQMMDIVALHIYPWRVEAPWDPTDVDTWARYEMLIDYARTRPDGSRIPVFLQETGQPYCRYATDEECSNQHPDMTLLLQYQRAVWNRIGELLRDAHVNGATYFNLRGFHTNTNDTLSRHCARHVDGTAYPVFQDISTILSDVSSARDQILESPIPVWVDKFAHPIFSVSLRLSLEEYKTARAQGIVMVRPN